MEPGHAEPGRPSPGPADSGWPDPRDMGTRRLGRALIDPTMPGVRVLALVGLLAAVVAGACLWWSRPDPRPVPQPVLRPAARPAGLTTASGTGTPNPSPAMLMVDVAGKVRHPGVVSLSTGARVIDAIKAAGGVRPGARTGTLNLARRVVDGEQILVGVDGTPAPTVPPPGPVASPGAPVPGDPVDLNTATVAQLDQLPGVGPVLAQRITDYRTQHGGFRSVDELRQVSGIGEAKYADLKNLVRV
jgi:competence protein ComEA